MFIYNRKTNKIFNLNAVANIFVGREGDSVSLGLNSGQISKFKEYNSEQEAREAIAMLAETIRVGKSEIFTMPESEELKQRIQNSKHLQMLTIDISIRILQIVLMTMSQISPFLIS